MKGPLYERVSPLHTWGADYHCSMTPRWPIILVLMLLAAFGVWILVGDERKVVSRKLP